MKKLLIISSFFIVLIAFSTIGYRMVSANEQINEMKDQLIEQVEYESYLTPYGYTLDNPNVILNPYKISPLTALILFETKEEESITVTIHGKDANSTYQNTFDKTTKHYIPIYGLYPNTTNKINIKCGKKTKTIEIKTAPIPKELTPKNITNNTNNLYFITTDTYTYALDNNNEVRWYLTKNYTKEIDTFQNGHLLLSTDTKNNNQYSTGLVEIDLLGKIYKQYNIDNGYYGSYAETNSSLFILSNKLYEIDKQTGTVLNTISLDQTYQEVFYTPKTNTITLANTQQTYHINLTTQEKTILPSTKALSNEQEKLIPVYNTNEQYKLTKAVKFTTNQKTPQSDTDIFLVGYKKIDNNYKQHNITITKTSDNLQLTGKFSNDEKVYLILDKFLDKRVYDVTSAQTIINKEGLTGKYSIYIKINETIYKTNTYINF